MNWQALLSRSVWNNTVSEWAFAVLVMILVTACISAIRRLGFYYFANLAKRTETQIDDAVVQVIGKTKWFFYLAVSVFAASRALDFPERFATGVDRAVFLAVLLQIGVWATWTVRVVVSSWAEARVGESERSAKTFAAAVRFVSSLVIWSVVAVFMLSNLGVEVSALLAGLGVGGVAVALAAQNVLGDLFASISIYLDRPFDIGDFVVVDALRGTVERVGLRSSRIRSITGEQVVVANRTLVDAKILNFERLVERRVIFSIGVVYGTPAAKLEKIPELIKSAVEGIDGLTFERCHFRTYGDFSLNFETAFVARPGAFDSYVEKHHRLNLAIYKAFEAEDIDFAFPTQTLYVNTPEPKSESV